jgi:SAM-dependent methyltransferase
MGTLRWAVIRPIIERLAPARVLEVGCGEGAAGARIAGLAGYVGVEKDLRCAAVARARVERAGGRVVHGTPEDLSGEPPFDLVCAFEVLEHLEDDVVAARSWASWLRPGGALMVSVPAWPARFGAADRAVGHYRRYTPDDLGAVFRGAGLSEIERFLYGWPVGFPMEAVRNTIAARTAAPGRSMEERTAGSGRWLQPGERVGRLIKLAAAPLARLQAIRPDRGVGLVGLAFANVSDAAR